MIKNNAISDIENVKASIINQGAENAIATAVEISKTFLKDKFTKADNDKIVKEAIKLINLSNKYED
jgi:F0F1-type ATP synthase membrane subunit b/b'